MRLHFLPPARRRTAPCVASLLAAGTLVATPLLAQDVPFPAADSAGCTYERCALRFEEPEVRAGVPGVRDEAVGRFGLFRAPDLRERAAGSDSAWRYAGLVVTHHRRATAGYTIGTVLVLASLVVLVEEVREFRENPSGALIGLTVGGAVASSYGAWELREARRALARSIWWYNRDLARGSAPAGR